MKKTLRILSWVLVFVFVVGLATACNASKTPETATNTVTNAPDNKAVTTDRTIRMAVSGEPIVDPAIATYWAAFYPYLNVYDALTKYDENGMLKSMLAESWEPSIDGMTWTFKLKEGVKFHDGSEVHASDVVFSINRILMIKSGLYYIFNGIVKNVEAKDDYTVVFNLNKPDGVFADRVSRLCILNEKLILANLDKNNPNYNYGEKYGDLGIKFLLSHDAGSGPYMVKEIVSGNSCTTVQFPDYHIAWSESAPTTVIYINNNVAATQGTMLGSNELDFSDNWQNNEIYSNWDKTMPDIDIAKYSDYSMLFGYFNTQKAPTDDIYIRKAISSLVDYDSIIKNILPYCALAKGPVPSAFPGASSKLTDVPYKYNLEQAAAYLAKSKYANNIKDYEIEMFIITGSTYQEQIGLMMQAAAQKIGINLTLSSGPFSTLIGRVGQMDTTPNISVVSNAPNYNDAGDIFISYFSKSSQGTAVNMAWMDDEDYEKMVYDAIAIPDQTNRYAAYADIQDYLNDKCYAIPFCELTEQVAYRSKTIKWPAAEHFVKTGKLNNNIVSFHYWFPDFEVTPVQK